MSRPVAFPPRLTGSCPLNRKPSVKSTFFFSRQRCRTFTTGSITLRVRLHGTKNSGAVWLKSEHLKLAAKFKRNYRSTVGCDDTEARFLVNDLKRLILSINGGRAARLVDASRLYRCEIPFEVNPKAGFKGIILSIPCQVEEVGERNVFRHCCLSLGDPRVRIGD